MFLRFPFASIAITKLKIVIFMTCFTDIFHLVLRWSVKAGALLRTYGAFADSAFVILVKGVARRLLPWFAGIANQRTGMKPQGSVEICLSGAA